MFQQSDLDLLTEYATAQIPHSGGTVFSHLHGTFRLLEAWGASRTLCLAGLYHGIYGTEASPRAVIPLSDRGRVCAAIGGEAEVLVYLFCVGRRPFLMTLNASDRSIHNRLDGSQIAITEADLRDLIELEVANWVELLPRYSMHDEMLDRFTVAFEMWREFMSLNAYRAMERALLDKCRHPPSLGRRAGHVLTSRLPWLRRRLSRVRRWRDKRF